MVRIFWLSIDRNDVSSTLTLGTMTPAFEGSNPSTPGSAILMPPRGAEWVTLNQEIKLLNYLEQI